MSNPHMTSSLAGRFCGNCGEFVQGGIACPKCGQSDTDAGEDALQINVSLSTWICTSCNTQMSVGTAHCPKCGEPASEESSTDPTKSSINRWKLRELGGFVEQMTRACSDGSVKPGPLTQITDDQFLAYINRNGVISTDLMPQIKSALKKVDTSSPAAIRSSQTRQGMEALVAGAQAAAQQLAELESLEVRGVLSDFLTLLQSVYRSLLDLYGDCVAAIMVITIEEAQEAQRSVSASMDHLGIIAQAMARELDGYQIDSFHKSDIDSRLSEFVGIVGRYRDGETLDLASVLSAGISTPDDMETISHKGLEFFRELIDIEADQVSFGDGLSLFAMAAEMVAQKDPVTLRKRTNLVLQLLEEAFAHDQMSFIDSFVEAERDSESAAVHLLSLADRAITPRQSPLPWDAARQELVDFYGKLLEWVYSRLLNLPLVAKSVLIGAPASYDRFAVMDLGGKLNELRQTSDHRFLPALLGVNTIVRNAGAHGGVDTSGERIVFTSRDRKGVVRSESLTDDQLVVQIEDLTATCRTILAALGLFRINHQGALPEYSYTANRRIATEVSRAIVGYFGLRSASTDLSTRNKVILSAEVANRTRGEKPGIPLLTAMTVAGLYPPGNDITVKIRNGSQKVSCCAVRTSDVLDHQVLPEYLTNYSIARFQFGNLSHDSELGDESRPITELLRVWSRMLLSDIHLTRAGEQGGGALSGIPSGSNSRGLVEVVDSLSDWLNAYRVADTETAIVQSFLLGLAMIKRGLLACNDLARRRKSSAAATPNKHLAKGVRILSRWAK